MSANLIVSKDQYITSPTCVVKGPISPTGSVKDFGGEEICWLQ